MLFFEALCAKKVNRNHFKEYFFVKSTSIQFVCEQTKWKALEAQSEMVLDIYNIRIHIMCGKRMTLLKISLLNQYNTIKPNAKLRSDIQLQQTKH